MPNATQWTFTAAGRHPSLGRKVLAWNAAFGVFMANYGPHVGTWTNAHPKPGITDEDGQHVYSRVKVTAWQPLPEPPTLTP